MDFMDTLRMVLNEVYDFINKDVLRTVTNDDLKTKALNLAANVRNVSNRAKLMQITDANNYTDMSKKSMMLDEYVGPDAKQHRHSQEVFYSTTDDVQDEDEMNECPYKNALVSELNPVKSGLLHRKESMIFAIFKGNREYFVVLLDEWLLFYNSNKKTQALETYPLKSCTAMELGETGNSFVLYVAEKTLTMMAKTRKEKLQWISAISDIDNYKKSLGLEAHHLTVDKAKHISLESNTSNEYADIDQNRKDQSPMGGIPLPEPPSMTNTLRIPRTPPRVPTRSTHMERTPVASTIITPCEDDDGDEYQFVNVQSKNNNEYINGYPQPPSPRTPQQLHQLPATQLSPQDDSDDYQFVGQITQTQSKSEQFGTPPEAVYNYASNGYPTEDLYESIPENAEEAGPSPSTLSRRENDVVPPPPKHTSNFMSELRLKQKLKKQHPK